MSHLSTQTDVVSLSRCSSSLHSTVVPFLYRNIEVSIFNIRSLAEALKRNESLPKRCRQLTLTLKGNPLPNEVLAYSTVTTSTVNNMMSADRELLAHLRKGILDDLEYVIRECSNKGTLKHFSWDIRTHVIQSFEWLMPALENEKVFESSNKTLRSFQCSAIRHIQVKLDWIVSSCYSSAFI